MLHFNTNFLLAFHIYWGVWRPNAASLIQEVFPCNSNGIFGAFSNPPHFAPKFDRDRSCLLWKKFCNSSFCEASRMPKILGALSIKCCCITGAQVLGCPVILHSVVESHESFCLACETSGRLWVGVSQVKLKFHGYSRAVEHRSHFARLTMAAQIVAMLCMLIWAFLSPPSSPLSTRLLCLHSAILPSPARQIFLSRWDFFAPTSFGFT